MQDLQFWKVCRPSAMQDVTEPPTPVRQLSDVCHALPACMPMNMHEVLQAEVLQWNQACQVRPDQLLMQFREVEVLYGVLFCWMRSEHELNRASQHGETRHAAEAVLSSVHSVHSAMRMLALKASSGAMLLDGFQTAIMDSVHPQILHAQQRCSFPGAL